MSQRAQFDEHEPDSEGSAAPSPEGEPLVWPAPRSATESLLGRLVCAELADLELPGADSTSALEAGPAPTETEVGDAFRTVLRHVRARRRDEWERAVDGLLDSPSLEPDQLYQAQRHAALKRWVLEHVPMVESSAFAALVPDRVGRDTNTARVIERLRGERQLLAVPYKRGWRYPVAQVDRRGRVHQAIPALLERAFEQHYESWEIVRFLARPVLHYPPVVVGRAVPSDRPFESLDELVDAAMANAPRQAPPTQGPSPFELLAAGDDTAFERAVERFLGPVVNEGANERTGGGASGESPAAA